MCQSSSIFFWIACQWQHFLDKWAPRFLSVAPLFVYWIVSFSEGGKKSRGRVREEAKYKNKLAQRDEWDIKRLDGEGWMKLSIRCSVFSEVRVYITLCFWNNNHHNEHQGADQSELLHCSLSAEENSSGLSLPLSLFLTHSHNHCSLHIWRERIERVPYCPLSGDVGVCVRAWLLLVYIRVLNSRIALSIWARQIYLCCGSFMHLLFPKRIGMHQWKKG